MCYWAVRKLGFSATELSKKLGVPEPSVSIGHPGNRSDPENKDCMLVQLLAVDHLALAPVVKIIEDGFHVVSGVFVKGPGTGILNPL